METEKPNPRSIGFWLTNDPCYPHAIRLRRSIEIYFQEAGVLDPLSNLIATIGLERPPGPEDSCARSAQHGPCVVDGLADVLVADVPEHPTAENKVRRNRTLICVAYARITAGD